MKKFLLLVLLLLTTCLWAYAFESGELDYNITSSSAPYTVEVAGANKSITIATIPETVTYYGTTYSVTRIGNYAFSHCKSLTSITIPNSVTSIGGYAFRNCSSLTSITIPNSVTSIGTCALQDCSSLTSITIPNSVTNIEEGAFYRCSSLTSIAIPNSVTSIGDYAFEFCSSLTSITIGNSVTSIGDEAFACCASLTSITIPNSVTSIGDHAFADCTSLTSVTIGNSVTSIGSDAFYSCSALTSITIPNSVTSIGERAFCKCSSLTSVAIPNSVTSIGRWVFSDCSSLSSIVVETGNTTYDSRDNCNAIIETATNTLVIGYKNTIIPNSVTSIGDYAFSSCTSLASITIPNSVTSIGENAFDFCSSLTSITIPNSVTSIGGGAFLGCTSLTSIAIPNSVTSIGDHAFWACSSLTSITIPHSVTNIEEGAFLACSSLTSITIPNSVTSIGDYAFSGCTSLASITIPNSVTSIGENAFRDCTSLQSITCKSETPPTIYNSTFQNVSTSIPIYVPCGTVDTYNASTWNYFSNIQESLSEYAIVVSSIDNKQGSAKLDKNSVCGSVISATANTGYHFTQWSDGILDNPRTFIPTQDTTFMAEFAPDRHTISAYTSDSERGTVSGGSTADYGSYVTITATANYGYHFTCWDDGNTDNPRRIQVTKDISFTAYFDKNTYYITKRYNSEHGYIEAPDSAQYLDRLILTATPKHGYSFSHWGDGQKNNPRALLLTQDTTLSAEFIILTSGQCGDDLYWSYDETTKTISITGFGEMYDYTIENQPWALFREDITEVYIDNTVSSIGTSAFNKCKNLGKLSIGGAMNKIAENAFANCSRLYDIECYAVMPPASDISSFINYNAFVTVLCDSKRFYEADMVWGNFRNLDCIGAESENMGGDDVVITPGSTDVTITWPTENNADTYTIVITKDGEVVCTLTFNSNGQLLNIAFAPGRQGNHPAQYAEQANNGYRFTVTGLEEATDYTYTITTKDASNKTINTHSGKFTTKSITAVENTHSQSPMTNCQKLIRNGQLVILRDGVEYNAQGVRL